MKHSRIALIIIGVLLTAQAATPRPCIGQECTGRYKGKAPSSAELQEILKQHGVWVKVFPYAQYHLDDPRVANDPRRANLCGANLASAGLNRASLAGANLDGANLSQANLDGANFSQANLDGAYLDFANLSGAYLDGAHLIGADLSRANLTYADLSQA